ncbi:uncharacterized protein B4U79_12163 [Dinothrombium tinctorium]|uniref:BHLH domain-containing protein n=1 Tax=Dinothrombium tinctorium TaxID=1965070 RepID=A0A3S3P680_9ACAR|nr:uncharacterized protein B4U79_12163 [Dinothrombium tinctorium]
MFNIYGENIQIDGFVSFQQENSNVCLDPQNFNAFFTVSSDARLSESSEDTQIIDTTSENMSETQRIDPFSSHCRIPIPSAFTSSCFDSASFIRRRNERERVRVRNVNEGFDRLRSCLPLTRSQQQKRISKVETLRFAIAYIKHLQSLLNDK